MRKLLGKPTEVLTQTNIIPVIA